MVSIMTEDGEPTHIDTLQKYKLRLEKKRDVYHTRYKYDKEFINKNRERARSHYHRNKEKPCNGERIVANASSALCEIMLFCNP